MKHDLKLPPDTEIHILAPEKDVDHFYLGEELDTSLKGLQRHHRRACPRRPSRRPPNAVAQPANISATDFRVLQSRMLSNGLAFAAKESSIQNNLSVVLLIEWKKRRLLFVGDAEWEGEFKEGKHNGSWNVMWEKHRKTHLKAPLDFLKIGHHGSINATPPPAPNDRSRRRRPADGVYAILDTILPVPKNGAKPTAQAIVSTEREFYNPIPECKLLVDLARRVSNTRVYGERLKKKGIDPKTDLGDDEGEEEQVLREVREGVPGSAPAAAHGPGVRSGTAGLHRRGDSAALTRGRDRLRTGVVRANWLEPGTGDPWPAACAIPSASSTAHPR